MHSKQLSYLIKDFAIFNCINYNIQICIFFIFFPTPRVQFSGSVIAREQNYCQPLLGVYVDVQCTRCRQPRFTECYDFEAATPSHDNHHRQHSFFHHDQDIVINRIGIYRRFSNFWHSFILTFFFLSHFSLLTLQ